MGTTSAIKLEDANGSVIIATRIEDLAITFAFAPGEDGEPVFRMFEEERAKLREFLRESLDG